MGTLSTAVRNKKQKVLREGNARRRQEKLLKKVVNEMRDYSKLVMPEVDGRLVVVLPADRAPARSARRAAVLARRQAKVDKAAGGQR